MLAISENSPMLAHGVVAKITIHLALTRSICLPRSRATLRQPACEDVAVQHSTASGPCSASQSASGRRTRGPNKTETAQRKQLLPDESQWHNVRVSKCGDV